MKSALSLTLAAGLAASLAALPARAADMELEVQGLTQTQGDIMVALYAGAKSWLGKPVAVARIKASEQKDGKLVMPLPNLPEGSLALTLFHDVNSNGKLDMNAMGMPTEPYGFSNNAAGVFGPPGFDKALFTVKAGARISVQLN